MKFYHLSQIECIYSRALSLFTSFFFLFFNISRELARISVVKDPPAYTGDAGDADSTPGSGRSSGIGNGNTLQHTCLENNMDREAWRAAVHGFPKSWTPLNN